MPLLFKQVVRSSQSSHDLEAVVLDTPIGPAEQALCTAMSEQDLIYAAETNRIGRGNELGPPHVWSFGGMMTSLCNQEDQVEAGSDLNMLSEELKNEFGKYEALSVPAKANTVRYCRLSKLFDEKVRRVTLAFAEDEASQLLKNSVPPTLVSSKFAPKSGRAPAIHMERELQGWLETAMGKTYSPSFGGESLRRHALLLEVPCGLIHARMKNRQLVPGFLRTPSLREVRCSMHLTHMPCCKSSGPLSCSMSLTRWPMIVTLGTRVPRFRLHTDRVCRTSLGPTLG